jgi:hypothetical protein
MDIPEIPNRNGTSRFLTKKWLIGLLVTIVLLLLGGAAKIVGDRYSYLEARSNTQQERDTTHAKEHGEFKAGIEDLKSGQKQISDKLDRLIERTAR